MRGPRLDQEPRKNVSICLSTEPSRYQELLHGISGAHVIFSKEYGGGTLYLMFHPDPQKMHSTLDTGINALEGCSFQTISDFKSGKIKTFKRREHMFDEHYIAIFSGYSWTVTKRTRVQPGVEKWSSTSSTSVSSATSVDELKRAKVKALQKQKYVENRRAIAKIASIENRQKKQIAKAETVARLKNARLARIAVKAQAKLDKASASAVKAQARLDKATAVISKSKAALCAARAAGGGAAEPPAEPAL